MKTLSSYPRYWISLLVVLALLLSSAVDARTAPAGGPYNVYAQVVIYDVLPGKEKEFERLLMSRSEPGRASTRRLINERVMRNVDGAVSQYATYSKFYGPGEAKKFLNARLDSVKSLCRRAPETHLVALDRSYFHGGSTQNPTGMEFGAGKTGQIAHLGLFVPTPDYTQEYFDALYKVKEYTVNRKPEGYLGDDLLLEEQAGRPENHAPHTPRPTKSVRMSVNYGEYATLENAEDSYIDRAQPGNPDLAALERIFFSTLQVPTRFYIFQVFGNF